MAGPLAGARGAALGGALGLASGLLDFAWSSPNLPGAADPDEAHREVPGLLRVTRYLCLVLSGAFVVASGLTVLAVQLRLKARSASAQVTLLLGAALSLVALASDRLAGPDRFYYGPQYHGPFWGPALAAQIVATLSALYACVRIAAESKPKPPSARAISPASRGKGELHLLLLDPRSGGEQELALEQEQASDSGSSLRKSGWLCRLAKRFPWIMGGLALSVAGVLLLALGVAVLATQPQEQLFGSLLWDQQSFLEFHLHQGEAELARGAARVEWSPDWGVRVVDLSDGRAVLQSPSGASAFLVASQSGEPGSRLRVASDAESGLFSVSDRPGRRSTEQVLETVTRSPDGQGVTFGGFLYYGPFESSAWRTRRAHCHAPFGRATAASSGSGSVRLGAPALDELRDEVLRATSSGGGGNINYGNNGSGRSADPKPWRTRFEFTVRASRASNGALVLHYNATLPDNETDRLYLVLLSSEEERLFGLGESYTWMDLKGGVVPILSREQGVGRGLEPLSAFVDMFMTGTPSGSATQFTYTAIPHLTSSQGRSLFVAGTSFMVFDLTRADVIAVEVNATCASGVLLAAARPLQLVEAYTEVVSGRMRALPAWTGRGLVAGLQGGRETVERKLRKLLDAGVPVAAVWLQDWAGQRNSSFGQRLEWNWAADERRYPDWAAWVDGLFQRHGINVLTYVNPYLATGRPMHAEALREGCLANATEQGAPLEQASATPDFRFGTVALYEPRCMDWYVALLRRNLLGLGANGTASSPARRAGALGWMADFGESLPFEGRAPELHNAFPQLWAEANRRVIEGDAFSAEQAVFFTRSAGALSPRYTTLQWMGDQLTSWDARDGLHSALIAQLAAGLSGLSHAHSDVGGYTMIKADPLVFLRDAQLLLRWAEMSAFADSVLRTHEGLWPADSAQAYDDDVLPGLARMAKCHALLWPLRDALQRKSPGLPLVRHAWMHMPEDPQALRIKTQFFLASDEVIVCPVLHPNRTSASCYLPARSDFEHAFRPEVRFEQRDTARWVDCPAPLGSPCVLFAANSTSFRPLAEAMRRL